VKRLLLPLLACARLAWAAPSPSPATYFGRPFVVLPEVELSASTDNAAEVRIGFELRNGLGKHANVWDFSFIPELSTSTRSGISSLFSSSSETPVGNPWYLGASFAFTKISSRTSRASLDGVYQKAFAACAAHCGHSPLPPDQQSFCELAFPGGKRSPRPADIDPSEYCAETRDAIKRANDDFRQSSEAQAIARERLFPVHDFSFGARAGAAQEHFLDPQPPGSMTFVERNQVAALGSAALSYTWVQPHAASSQTVEAFATYDYRWDASETKAHWCHPAGDVMRPGQPPATDPAQICADLPLGVERNSHVTMAVLWGMVDKDTPSFWRASFGPRVEVVANSGETHLGLLAPLYLNFVALGVKEPNYQGLIRLSPRVGAMHDSVHGWSYDVSVDIALLGRRNLFERALDRLR
jgi:hypothetical protein